MEKKKYTVFISSTFEDLKDARDLAIRTILKMGHIPIGMEAFNATDEEQWDIIKQSIDACDYYIVIVAHRYGTLAGDISITEKEYNYASDLNIPRLRFIIDEQAPWEPRLMDIGNIEKLTSFKKKLTSLPVEFWKSIDELPGKIAITLSNQIAKTSRPGWVRGNDALSNETISEITRLSRENNELRNEIADLSQQKLNFDVSDGIFLLGRNNDSARFLIHFASSSSRALLFTPNKIKMKVICPDGEYTTTKITLTDSHANRCHSITAKEAASFNIQALWDKELRMPQHPWPELEIEITLSPSASDKAYTLKLPLRAKEDKPLQWRYSSNGC